MAKKISLVFHYTLDSEDNNKIHRVVIDGENEKFIIRKFEKKYTNINLISMSRI